MSFLHSLVYLPHLPIVDISSVCSLIDRTEIKINICTIPTLHPLVSIRSSLLCSALTIPHTPSHHPPWNKSVQDNWAALSLWNEGWDMERERLQLWAAHWWYLSLHCFVFSRSLFYVGLTGNCAAVIQDQGEREREGEREGKVLNCCNKLQISHRLSINVIKTQSTNTQLTVKAKTHLCRFTFQNDLCLDCFDSKSRISCERCKWGNFPATSSFYPHWKHNYCITPNQNILDVQKTIMWSRILDQWDFTGSRVTYSWKSDDMHFLS